MTLWNDLLKCPFAGGWTQTRQSYWVRRYLPPTFPRHSDCGSSACQTASPTHWRTRSVIHAAHALTAVSSSAWILSLQLYALNFVCVCVFACLCMYVLAIEIWVRLLATEMRCSHNLRYRAGPIVGSVGSISFKSDLCVKSYAFYVIAA